MKTKTPFLLFLLVLIAIGGGSFFLASSVQPERKNVVEVLKNERFQN